jgi:hypothetical protein
MKTYKTNKTTPWSPRSPVPPFELKGYRSFVRLSKERANCFRKRIKFTAPNHTSLAAPPSPKQCDPSFRKSGITNLTKS